MKRILFAASESTPFAKTGGLADVVGSLPKFFPTDDYDVRVILPKYLTIDEKWRNSMKHVTSFHMDMSGGRQYVGLLEMEYEGIHFYFIDNEEHFGGREIYAGMPWDLGKYTYFCKAVLSALPVIGFHPDIIHCHDWQTGLIPVYLKERFYADPFYRSIKTIMTIHNLKFQGLWNIPAVKHVTGLADYFFTPDKMEKHGDASLLKGGLVYADCVTTVSATYAEEIKTSFYGEGLEGLMCARSASLVGIVNGLDYDEWNPATDPYIANHFGADDFRKEKVKNKLALQKELGLPEDPGVMMIGMVSRLTDQKGFDLIAYMMEELCRDHIQLVVLGTGEERYENMFRHFAWKYPDKVSANIYYSNALSHKIYAGCDAFLMPSLFEPCGLSQLMSLRYGTVPIVRETGGLKDTVEAYNEYEHTGTGFSFANYNAHEMMDIIRYAEKTYYDTRGEWNRMVKRGMKSDFSWYASAKQYEDLYDQLTGY